MGFKQDNATTIFEDNQGTIALARNPVDYSRTKHIDIKYHNVREVVSTKEIDLEYCPTQDIIADSLTKGLP